jgi:hypothetical protein
MGWLMTSKDVNVEADESPLFKARVNPIIDTNFMSNH